MHHQRRAASRSKTGESSSSEHAGPALTSLEPLTTEPAHTADPATFDPGDDWQTTHEPVTPDDAVNAGEFEEAARIEGEREVQVLHGPGSPLGLCGAPSEEDIVKSRASTGVCDPGWEVIHRQVGTVEQPEQLRFADPGTLFIDGTPTMDDVHQGGIADCYFLASIASIVQSDPGRIRDMMTLSGGQVTVEFFKFDPSKSTWTPAAVTVSTDLLHYADGDGFPAGLVGAGFRAGSKPISSLWYANVESESLWIYEDATFELALWAPVLAKAYAKYAEQFGQYGGFDSGNQNKSTDEAGNARSGYEIVGGGIAHYTYPIVYGPNIVDFGETAIAYTPGSDLVASNLGAIENLLRLSGYDVPNTENFHMTVGLSRSDALERLDAQLAHTVNQPYMRRYAASFSRMLSRLRDSIQAWRDAPDDSRDTAQDRVAQRAAAAVAPGNWPVIDSDREDGDFRRLQELLLVVKDIATDGAEGQRFTYAWHSYSVVRASFADDEGKALALTTANLATEHPKIDTARSTVRLRNPHGRNEPDRRGDGADDGQDDGEFNVTLEQLFRVFGFQQWGQTT